MKSILKRNRVLAVIALIGLLASLVPLISRVQAEKSNKYYDIVLDYNSRRSMARQSSQSEDEWIDLFKSLGVDKVALSEASALNLHDNAAIPVYAMTVKKAAESYGWEDQYPAEVAQWLRESTDVSDAIIWTETAASYEWILNAFEARFEDFEAKVKDPRTKLFILCNPQNPTGRVFTREELIRLGELCLKYHVTVLSDEIHSDLVYSGHKHIPFASISKEFEQNTISFMNPSKTFNLPGFRTAAFIASNPVLKNAVHDMVVNNKAIGENICGTVAFCTAYEQCAYYADQMVAYLEENRNLVEETLKDVDGIDVIHAEGTYLLWLDCRKLNMSQEELDRFFVETVKLGLNSGKSFGPEGNGFLRMNIACPRSTVKEAMNRIVTAVKAL